ncbi:LOW QUALITY PROTEIN: hypothetical protein M8C21_005434, partial [Ambrosia artemisiifolia]
CSIIFINLQTHSNLSPFLLQLTIQYRLIYLAMIQSEFDFFIFDNILRGWEIYLLRLYSQKYLQDFRNVLSKKWYFELSTEKFASMHFNRLSLSKKQKFITNEGLSIAIFNTVSGQHHAYLSNIICFPITTIICDIQFISSLHGLLLVCEKNTDALILWNPTTTVVRILSVYESGNYYNYHLDAAGLYMDSSKDYKILHLRRYHGVMLPYVYSRRSASWRFIVSKYWSECESVVMAFDVNEETFRKISFPYVQQPWITQVYDLMNFDNGLLSIINLQEQEAAIRKIHSVVVVGRLYVKKHLCTMYPLFWAYFYEKDNCHHLELPKSYKKLNSVFNYPLGPIRLFGEDGRPWNSRIEIEKCLQRVWLTYNWGQIMCDNGLEKGDILVFQYVDNNAFRVRVWRENQTDHNSRFHFDVQIVDFAKAQFHIPYNQNNYRDNTEEETDVSEEAAHRFDPDFAVAAGFTKNMMIKVKTNDGVVRDWEVRSEKEKGRKEERKGVMFIDESFKDEETVGDKALASISNTFVDIFENQLQEKIAYYIKDVRVGFNLGTINFAVKDVIGYVKEIKGYDDNDNIDKVTKKRLLLDVEDHEGVSIRLKLWKNYADQFSTYVQTHNNAESLVIILQFGNLSYFKGIPYISTRDGISRVFINEPFDFVNEYNRRLVKPPMYKPLSVSCSTGLQVFSPNENDFLVNNPYCEIGDVWEIVEEVSIIILGTVIEIHKDLESEVFKCIKEKCHENVVSAIPNYLSSLNTKILRIGIDGKLYCEHNLVAPLRVGGTCTSRPGHEFYECPYALRRGDCSVFFWKEDVDNYVLRGHEKRALEVQKKKLEEEKGGLAVFVEGSFGKMFGCERHYIYNEERRPLRPIYEANTPVYDDRYKGDMRVAQLVSEMASILVLFFGSLYWRYQLPTSIVRAEWARQRENLRLRSRPSQYHDNHKYRQVELKYVTFFPAKIYTLSVPSDDTRTRLAAVVTLSLSTADDKEDSIILEEEVLA